MYYEGVNTASAPRKAKDSDPVPHWFYESYYFAFWGSRTAAPGSDPHLESWSLADYTAEVARIMVCENEDEYLHMSRTGARHRMDRCAKRAWWAVVRGGVRW